jgi:plastocyanin
MLKRGKTGRRLGFVAAAVAIAVMVCAGIALAASDTITAGPSESFSQPNYNTDQGVVVQFQDNGGTHNVTARQTGPDGSALFRSPTISGGSAGVQGTQFLTAGDYAFFCTVHPTTMSGTPHVTSSGAAVARPTVAVVVKSKKLAKASKKGILVALTTNSKVDGASLTAKLGKTTIGQASGVSLAAGQQFATVKLSKAGKNKLKGKKKATITVTANVPFGSPASGKSKLT